ncbi:tRNA1(Val) (adenine(37)-N6)-methyltransferase [Ancylomarina sp. 16SWW S1-10-2]|uniref:tRNA1(Val) (adenine(37)-N6)-methyltransferase n=1 Tax=Ancylomarina sp. 16SWW S1-10-2 TaxID=2499681 RepID=UPI0012AD76A3|nr:methyltransferase [Ancylomarina sp. 16SWW S1-10-2]MRT94640.1 methyltransferase domain-containing protein [Ancylomarina sp. 16SWW S1-10-2]
MANTYFQFKQFRINQEGSAMKVGTDGVLLGAWANVEKAKSFLDIGTGTGLIAIMLAQRTNNSSKIDAVEIDNSSYQQAVNNFDDCPWNDRIKAFHASFQYFVANTSSKYDCIVSNPPYFINSLKAKDESRTQARHADGLPFEDLIEGTKNLLNPEGKFSVILPVKEGNYFIRIACIAGFSLSKKIEVLPNPGKIAKRLLIELTLANQDTIETQLCVENGQRHVYSPEYIELCKDFYLKM